MKKKIQIISRLAIGSLFVTLLSLSANAQKLPAVQEASVAAPANVKVDAKLGEWENNFQALNKTTDIYYTMANDANNLYLVMKSADQANNNKIIGGGINLTINKANKKSEKDAFVVSFPVANMANLRNAMMSGMRTSRPAASGTTAQQGPDSAMIADMRKRVVSTFKEIKLIGFKDIPDSVISIYNEYGIKAFVDFDDKGSLVVEMAVPLKELGLDAGAAFTYNIKLNGINLNAMMSGMRVSGGPGGASFSRDGGGGGAAPMATTVVMAAPAGGIAMDGGGGMGMPRSMGDIANMLSPTDFWGKYTLIKK
ncbi:hypothetical protein HQ865_04440 [Mucilaginibacter mali]|uniref:Uncharacterized protein n=1 Tax=Mucilaginibacter mali TaxID=2740462 RepID=A0A7D4QIC9_9SPHI|nr:hypothetical protein [Mucilaginibacter mali]QKJ29030.1 hypothetical protein HQ865_04440 [Mucilaginibacter mali]